MKSSKFLLLSFLFLFVQSSFLSLNAQGEDPPVPNFLFLFGQLDVPPETGIIHTLTAQGTYWELDAENEEFPISDDGDLEEAYANIDGSTTSEPSYDGSTAWKGFYFPWGPNPYQYTDDIAYGFYIVTGVYDYYFYIDIRDCKYRGPASFVSGTYNPDFFIRFDDDTDIFEWRAPSGDWTEISVGEVLNVWDIRNNGTPPTTSYFEDFWENCLVVTNNGNGNPRTVWGPNPDFQNILGYKVYRAVHWVPYPDPIVYSLIATVDDETFEYTDTQLKLSQNGDYVWYYVKAYNSQTESSQSNVVTTRAGFYKKNNFDKLSSTSYGLNQNFPNPFNPTTQIDYTIKLAELVTIKVYDVLGNEVASLVNEWKQPGNYSTTFDAVNLPSGLYIYRIVSGNFQATKKMILLK